MAREYKDSGIEWIGQIPKEWVICQLKRLLSFQNGQDYKHVESESGFPVYGSGGVFRYASQFLYDGEAVLFGRKGTVDKPLYVNEKFWTVDTMYYAIPLGKTIGKYIYYLSTQLPFDKYQTSTALPSMTQAILGNLCVVIPNISIQQKITNYLDKVCGEVDEMVALQETMIEELKAYKQSVITEAVTKGLNPDVPMRESGIDWIGEIPEHWEVIRIKYLLNERKERSVEGLEEPLSMSQKYGLIPTKEMDMIPNIASSFVGAKLVYQNDLVFNKLKAHLGVFSVSDYDGLVSPDYAVYFSIGKANVKYLEYLFKTPQYIGEFIKLSSGVGAGLTRLYTSDLYSIKAILPPIDEQNMISAYIVQKSSEIDSLIALKQAKIEELKEYKKSVIYEYVTGKKEVV